MDDTPKAFFEELRTSVMKKRVGQIALAVLLAESIWRLLASLIWNLVIPTIGKGLQGHTESVLYQRQTQNPIPWEILFGSLLEFCSVVIVVFYLNRWIQGKRSTPQVDEARGVPPSLEEEPAQTMFNSVGDPVD